MNELQTVGHEKSALVPMEFNESQVALIKTTVARGTTNDQLALFLYTCKKTGLDPLAKQIHCIVRQTKNGPVMSIQTAIDGYRLVADRSGKYAGNDDPVYDNEITPTKATVTVYKIVSGVRCQFTATARWSQYYPGDLQGFMWKKMPHLMLGKCAEALALRKAFPAELSGIYTNDEMAQAEVVEVQHTPMQAPQRKSAQPETKEPTPEEIEAKVAAAQARLHEGQEQAKSEPAKPQTSANGVKTAKGLLTYRTKPNKGGYISYAVEGYQTEAGKDMLFSTKDATIIETLGDRFEKEVNVGIEYVTVVNGDFTNYNIVGLVSVE